jgi:hypothetical protein
VEVRVHCKAIFYLCIPRKRTARPQSHIPHFHIHASVSDLYIPMIGPPIFLNQNMQADLGDIHTVHINHTQKHECWNCDCGRAVPFLGIFVSNFRYSIFAVCNWVEIVRVYILQYSYFFSEAK